MVVPTGTKTFLRINADKSFGLLNLMQRHILVHERSVEKALTMY